jgi:hypothetical protein
MPALDTLLSPHSYTGKNLSQFWQKCAQIGLDFFGYYSQRFIANFPGFPGLLYKKEKL